MNGKQIYDMARYLEQLHYLGISRSEANHIAGTFLSQCCENFDCAIEAMTRDLAERRMATQAATV